MAGNKNNRIRQPVTVGESVAYSSPWFELIAKLVHFPDDEAEQTFWGIRAADCVSVVALTTDGQIPLVRQYRPVVERMMLELPSGHVEAGELPADAARRELQEETGLFAPELHLMAKLVADSGRLEYGHWCFFATNVVVGDDCAWREEPGVEVVYHTPSQLLEMLRRNEFNLAQHVAALGLAILQGRFPL